MKRIVRSICCAFPVSALGLNEASSCRGPEPTHPQSIIRLKKSHPKRKRMSEYQYYEFRAIDHRLTTEQIRVLRGYSSRAEITATTFAVEYNWGDFKGKPHQWMEQYFDAFVHFANWGTRWFMLRIPTDLLETEALPDYCVDDYLSFDVKKQNVILSFRSDDEDADWIDAQDSLWSLVPLRDALIKGDCRCLYLAWLRSIQYSEYEGNGDRSEERRAG